MDYYKEKYNTVLKKLQEALAPCEDGCKISGLTRDCLENIFPELKENEDERIKKAIIRILKGETGYTSKEDTDKYVAWLEKQGEKVTNINGAEWADEHPHWISVVEELPPRGRTDPNVSVPVITCKIVNRELHEIGFQQYIFGKGKWKYCDATHWMPMPSVEHLRESTKMIEKGGEE